MTVALDFLREAYIYAQSLNNEGQTEYWKISEGNKPSEQLTELDVRSTDIRNNIDILQATGRQWAIVSKNIDCRVTLDGLCSITVRPLTLDIDGRISPVVLLLNALKPSRHQGLRSLIEVKSLLNRELAAPDLSALMHLKSILNWPSLFIFLHILCKSKKALDD